MTKCSRTELYLPLLNDAILCQWHYHIPDFKFLASLSTITTSPPINRIFGNATTISNFYNLPLNKEITDGDLALLFTSCN